MIFHQTFALSLSRLVRRRLLTFVVVKLISLKLLSRGPYHRHSEIDDNAYH